MTDKKIKVLNYSPSLIEGLLESFFKKYLSLSDLRKVLWICPNRRLTRIRTAQLATFFLRRDIKAFEKPRILTLNDFSRNIAMYTFPGKFFLNNSLRKSLVRMAALKSMHEHSGKDSALSPSGINSLTTAGLEFIKEIKSYLKIFPEETETIIEEAFKKIKEESGFGLDPAKWDRAKRRVTLLVNVYKNYQKLAEKSNFVDLEDVFLKAPDHQYANSKLLVVDSFLDLAPGEEDFLKCLISRAEKTFVFNPELYPQPGKNYDRETASELTFIDKEVSTDRITAEITGHVKASFDEFETSVEEAREVSFRVKSLLEEGVEPSSILVIYPDLSTRATLIKENFEEFGIPYNISHGKNVKSYFLPQLITSLIDFCLNPTDIFMFFELLMNRSFKLISEKQKKKLLKALINAPFFSGLETIENTLRSKHFCETKDQEKLLVFLKRTSKLSTLNKEDLSEEIISLALEVVKHLDESANEEVDATIFALDLVKVLFEKSSGIIASMGPEQRIRFFRSAFLSSLPEVVMTDKGDIAEGVQVTGILETRGASYEYIFLLEMNDEVFPGSRHKNVYLPDKLRDEVGLPDKEVFFNKKSRDFWRLAFSAKTGLFISWPKRFKREERTKSRFVERFEREIRENKKLKDNFRIINWKSYKVDRDTNRLKAKVVKKPEPAKGPVTSGKKGGKPSVSVSLFSSYVDCPKKFWLKYQKGIDITEPPGEEIGSRELGSLMHNTISNFIKQHLEGERAVGNYIKDGKKNSLLEKVSSDLKISQLEVLGRMNLKNPGLNKVMLKKMLEQTAGFFASFIYNYSSERQIYSEERIKADFGNIFLTGRLDMFESSPEGRIISFYDFKTTTPSKSKKTRHQIQLFLYRKILEKNPNFNIHGDCSPYLVYLWDTGNALEPVSFDGRRKKFKDLKEKFQQYLEELVGLLNSGREPEKIELTNCNYCYMREACFVSE